MEMATMKMITVRVPNSLHRELLEEAEREGVSLNQLCLTKLARPLDWYRQKDAGHEVEQAKE
jgi:predicted HicB family RNase H-like nuclease